jgi:hypothetical protein
LRKLSAALKIVVSAAILLFLFHKVNLSQGAHHLRHLRYSFLLLSIVLIVIGQFVRAQRLAAMVFGSLGGEKMWRVLRIQMLSFLPGVVSPAKIGEVTKVYLLQTELNVPATRGLLCFAAERVLDLMLLTPLAVGGLYIFFRGGLFFEVSPGWRHMFMLLSLALAGIAVIGLLWMRSRKISLRDIWQTAAPHSIVTASVLTLLYWGIVLAEVWCFCRVAGFSAEIWHMALVVPPALLSSMIPISFSGFGVREAAMVIFFQRPPIGTSYEQALLISLMYDIIGLGVPAVMGVLFWLGRKGNDTARAENT